MSSSTSIHIGSYLVCKQKILHTHTIHRNTCPRDASHHVTEYNNFCATCGDKTTLVSAASGAVYLSLYDVSCGLVTRHRVDRDFINHEFQWFPSSWIGGVEPGHEIVGFRMKALKADHGAIHEMSLLQQGFTSPPQDMLDRLKQIVEYESIQVKSGVIISVD